MGGFDLTTGEENQRGVEMYLVKRVQRLRRVRSGSPQRCLFRDGRLSPTDMEMRSWATGSW